MKKEEDVKKEENSLNKVSTQTQEATSGNGNNEGGHNGNGNNGNNGHSLSNILSQKPLIKDADTESLNDKAEASDESFRETFNRAVKKVATYKTTAVSGAD